MDIKALESARENEVVPLLVMQACLLSDRSVFVQHLYGATLEAHAYRCDEFARVAP